MKGIICRKLSYVFLLNFIVFWVLIVCNDIGGLEERERERKRNICEMNSYDFWYILFFVLVKCLFLLNLKIFLIFKDIVLLLLFLDVILKKEEMILLYGIFLEKEIFFVEVWW